MVLEGEFDMTIGGERQTMKRGMSYVIPGDVPHALHGGPGKGLVLDIFSPPREDYKERIAEAITPAWETTEG
jgi:mannose-6-phosphate isomerase-like protein (cupin superfamily)